MPLSLPNHGSGIVGFLGLENLFYNDHMLTLEAKLRGKPVQYQALDEAIRTAQFIRNKALRVWMDTRGIGRYELQRLCAELAEAYEWAGKLNSMARQASADRAWQAIARFYDNCKQKKPGKKGFPRFKKRNRSVEYKTSGWKLSEDRSRITFTDGFKVGTLKLIGTRDLHGYPKDQIKRVRVVKRADGYYCQFSLDVDRTVVHEPTGGAVGIDLGLEFFYTDSDGKTAANPRLLRYQQKQLRRRQRAVSQKVKGSKNRRKAINRLGRKHLQLQRQRKDFAVQAARALVQSHDMVAFEDLQVRNMVRNHRLAKAIHDAAWSQFRAWLEYYGKLHGIPVVAVPPPYTSQDCSGCGTRVTKSLSTRTHSCPKCGMVLHRDHNAARNILAKGLQLLNTEGHSGINAWGDKTAMYSLATVGA